MPCHDNDLIVGMEGSGHDRNAWLGGVVQHEEHDTGLGGNVHILYNEETCHNDFAGEEAANAQIFGSLKL